MDDMEEELRRSLDGRYQLEGLIGRGGMGLVYLAHDLRLERPVAIKVPPPDRAADPTFRARFLREARTAAALAHPHIIPIFTVDEAGPFIYFAMAYVPGETLAQRVLYDGPFTPAAAARLLRELADALAYAHARGVVHRDVKPDNILLDAASGRALLSDFGIAHVSPDGRPGVVSSGSTLLGTAAFMSPEQARGGRVDARSDLYSLGVVGYYALSGHLPFAGENDAVVLALHCTTPPPPLDVPGASRRLVQVIERCLAKDADGRFADGAALGRALAAALPSDAPPPIAVRAFLTRSAHLAGPALLYEAVMGLVVLPLAAWSWLYAPLRARVIAGAVLAVAALAPLLVTWARTRRLLADGHDWEDLVDALARERERHREELRFVYGAKTSRFERFMQWLSRLALVAAVGITVALLRDPELAGGALVPGAFFGAAATALLAAMMARARTEQRTDPRGQRRLRFWSGRFGRLVFRLAAVGRRRGAPMADVQGLQTSA
jgi:eukaryotic-like serine/threonine-protein kinase